MEFRPVLFLSADSVIAPFLRNGLHQTLYGVLGRGVRALARNPAGSGAGSNADDRSPFLLDHAGQRQVGAEEDPSQVGGEKKVTVSSEERRVVKACVSTCRSRWSGDN